MAEYPLPNYSLGSQVLPLDNYEFDRAIDGRSRGRRINNADLFDVRLLHTGVKRETVDTLLEFFRQFPASENINVTWRGEVYLCKWIIEPEAVYDGEGRWDVTCSLIGVLPDEIGGVGGGGEGGAQESILIDFTTGSMDPNLDFDSAATRMHRTTSLTLESVSQGVPRFQRGVDGLIQGILLERGMTGILPHNRVFTTGNGWTHGTGTTHDSSTREDIFGGDAAFEFGEGTGANADHTIGRDLVGTILDNNPVCLMALVKYVDMPYISLMMRDKANNFPIQRFNIHPDNWGVHTKVEGGTGQVMSAGMEYFGDSWFIIWASFNARSGGTTPKFFISCVNADGTTNNYTGTNRSYIIAGGSAESSSFSWYPKMFFPVGSTATTKSNDILSLPSTFQAPNDFFVRVAFIAKDTARFVGSEDLRHLYISGNFEIVHDMETVHVLRDGIGVLSAAYTFIPGNRYDLAAGLSPVNGGQLVINGEEIATAAGLTGGIEPGTVYIGGAQPFGLTHCDEVIELLELGPWD